MFPLPSSAMPMGRANCAWSAGPPSPPKLSSPVPATVVMVPLVSSRRMRELRVSAMNRLPALSTATPKGEANCAWTAGPPSPPKPRSPVPATVVMVPEESTRRIRWLEVSAM